MAGDKQLVVAGGAFTTRASLVRGTVVLGGVLLIGTEKTVGDVKGRISWRRERVCCMISTQVRGWP